jgi:V/A-type H+/Na+-transporting ATPase subunit K
MEITPQLSAALVMGLSAIGAAYAIAATGTAGAGATVEKPEVFGKVMIFVALAEAIAIYGLVVALMILFG